jgi:ribosomal protein S18 acetylase RimI-like enzyme
MGTHTMNTIPIDLPTPHRPATPADDQAMAELVNLAGEGLPLYLWTNLAAPGQDPWAVGRERARREQGAFSYRNTVLREEAGRPVAALIGYPLADAVDPTAYDEIPPMFVPLQQLEDLAPGTWYVNILAVLPAFQGRGYGSTLLHIADQLAAAHHKSGLSIIVSDVNHGARRLYERHGCRQLASRPMVRDQWQHPGRNWVLLVKLLPATTP